MKKRIDIFEVKKVHEEYVKIQCHPHINLLTIEALIWILERFGLKIINKKEFQSGVKW